MLWSATQRGCLTAPCRDGAWFVNEKMSKSTNFKRQPTFFFHSDEELEDSKALLYLPIAPEVEDPEENPYGPPPDAVQSSLSDEGIGSEKKRQSSSDGPQAPKKKPKTTNIELQGVPNDGD